MDIAELSHPEKNAHILPMGGRESKTRSRWHKPAAGLSAEMGSAWEGEAMLCSRMWGLMTLGRGAFLHGSAGHGEGTGQLAALGAVSIHHGPRAARSRLRSPARPLGQGLGIPRWRKKAAVLLILARGEHS